jgi:hypothetical protein
MDTGVRRSAAKKRHVGTDSALPAMRRASHRRAVALRRSVMFRGSAA